MYLYGHGLHALVHGGRYYLKGNHFKFIPVRVRTSTNHRTIIILNFPNIIHMLRSGFGSTNQYLGWPLSKIPRRIVVKGRWKWIAAFEKLRCWIVIVEAVLTICQVELLMLYNICYYPIVYYCVYMYIFCK